MFKKIIFCSVISCIGFMNSTNASAAQTVPGSICKQKFHYESQNAFFGAGEYFYASGNISPIEVICPLQLTVESAGTWISPAMVVSDHNVNYNMVCYLNVGNSDFTSSWNYSDRGTSGSNNYGTSQTLVFARLFVPAAGKAIVTCTMPRDTIIHSIRW